MCSSSSRATRLERRVWWTCAFSRKFGVWWMGWMFGEYPMFVRISYITRWCKISEPSTVSPLFLFFRLGVVAIVSMTDLPKLKILGEACWWESQVSFAKRSTTRTWQWPSLIRKVTTLTAEFLYLQRCINPTKMGAPSHVNSWWAFLWWAKRERDWSFRRLIELWLVSMA